MVNAETEVFHNL